MGDRKPKTVPAHLRDVFIDHGLTFEGLHGDQIPSLRVFQDRVTEVITNPDFVVHAPEDRDRLARTPLQLCDEVFPKLADGDPRRSELARRIWDLAQTGPNGHVQRRLGEMRRPWLLCRVTVDRDGGASGASDACYVTDNHDLMLADNFQPNLNRLAGYIDSVADDMRMVIRRRPQMEAAIREEWDAAMRKVYETLGIPYSKQTAPQL